MVNERSVRFVDFYAIGNFHEMITKCLMLMFAGAYETINVVSGKSASLNMRNQIASQDAQIIEKFTFKEKWVCEKDNMTGAFLRMCMGFFFVLKEYLFFKETLLFLNYNNPFALPVILILNRFRKKKVLIIFHGELEALFVASPFYKLRTLYAWLNTCSLRYLLNGSSVKILLLGNSIKNNLMKEYPQIHADRILVINHPYIFPELGEQRRNPDTNKIIIGIIGTLNREKGLASFCFVAKHLENLIKQGVLELRQIGKLADEVDIKQYPYVQWTSRSLSRNEFDRQVSELDYILFLYPQDSYRFIASGALMDAVAFAKPVIALQNDYFKDVFKTAEIGLLFQDLNDMVQFLSELGEIDGKAYLDSFMEGFKVLKRKYSIDYNSELLLKQLDC